MNKQPMNSSTEHSRSVLQLRFPEFSKRWDCDKLGNIFEISAGGDIGKENVSAIKTDIFKYPIYANAEKEKGFYGYSDLYKVKENVVTVAGRGVNIGIAHARDHKFYPIVRLLVLEPKHNQNIYFFEYQINRLNLFKESTGVPQLTAPQVSGYEVLFPSIPEQEKIALFLRKIDKKLETLKKKKELLEQYKKGVTQKIFSRQLRFKDENGKEFPEWEKKKLEEIAFKNSSNISANTIEENFGEYIIYGASGKLKCVDFFREETEYISIVKDGAGVGRVYLCKAKSSVLGTLDIIKPIGGNLYYLFYFLQQTNFLKYVTGSTIPHIYFSDYKAEKILVPCLKEQTKIANFLSAIDVKINHLKTQIEKTEIYKKGLLQKMFC